MRAELDEDQQEHELAEPTPRIVGIGASAGGLEALQAFFDATPAQTGLAFVVVTHQARDHASLLPSLLQTHSAMPVAPVIDGARVVADHVYVIPPNKELAVFRGELKLLDLPSSRPSLTIDVFFRSLAEEQGNRAIAIVLSGTGSDGTLGATAIRGAAGMVMVQSEASARYDGMPRSVLAAKVADFVLSPDEMPAELVAYVARSEQIPSEARRDPGLLKTLFMLIRARNGHDFSEYKQNTIWRRVERRMGLQQLTSIDAYLRFVREHPAEIDLLFKELLIGVTSFFRDPPAWEALRDDALFPMLAAGTIDRPLRAWVPACSTGEEAYSVAIAFSEAMERAGVRCGLQVFGTDIDEEAIATARAGIYPASIAQDVGPERLEHHFYEENGCYRVRRSLRDLLVFAPQDVIRDPPFTKLDLLSCRNLLIYFSAPLQQGLLPLFHYSLNREGILFLGSSETTGGQDSLFEPKDRKWRVFQKSQENVSAPLPLASSARRGRTNQLRERVVDDVERPKPDDQLPMLEALLNQAEFPPSVVVTRDDIIVYVHGKTGPYLELCEGRATLHVLQLCQPGLKAELTKALSEARKLGRKVTRPAVHFRDGGRACSVDLVVTPVRHARLKDDLLLIGFIGGDLDSSTAGDGAADLAASAPATALLEDELFRTRERLRNSIEDLETFNEELKSTNEELQSTNEELQSTNEELETSKEELQSLNEEAATVNFELQCRVDELAATNDDMNNLLNSTRIATVFLDKEGRVRRFTPNVVAFIPLTAGDLGRPIQDLSTKLINARLSEWAEAVLRTLERAELEVRDTENRRWQLRIFPYRTTGNVIDGTVLTFHDTTELAERERLANQLQKSEDELRAIIENAPDYLELVDRRGTYLFVNRARPSFSSEELIGRATLYDMTSPEHHDRVRSALENVFTSGTTSLYEAYCPQLDRWFSNHVGPVKRGGLVVSALLVARDVTHGHAPVEPAS